ncbi:hypothetical protein RintRC_7555 [Richelia intracellularis]|nr:hypothetical protein RintRC_7555 [Richelia intracellularis]
MAILNKRKPLTRVKFGIAKFADIARENRGHICPRLVG